MTAPAADKPREGFVFFEFPTPQEADENIRQVMVEYPHLTKYQATMLVCYRATSQVSSMVKNTSGGGRYVDYCRKIGVKW